jgi:hypothetical protein
MGPIPYERFVAESTLPPHELVRRLAAQIDPPRFWGRRRGNSVDKPFVGHMDGDRFILWPLPPFERNAFRPVVVGAIEPHASGAIIRAVIRLHWPTAILMAIWISIPLSDALTQILASRPWLTILVRIAFALMGYLFCMTVFWLGARSVKRRLVDMARI